MSRHYIYRMEIVDCDTLHGIYIGQHKMGSKDPSCDGYKGSGCKWKREVLSQHIPVKKTILKVCEDIKETNYWEHFYIEQAIQNGEFLWNVVKGGGGHERGRVYTDEEIKAHQKERFQRWYDANQEHISEYRKRYFQDNKEAIMANHRKYAEKNRETAVEYHRNYYQKNKERLSALHKQYYEEHKDELLNQRKEYRKQYAKINAERLAEKAKQYNEAHREERIKDNHRLCCYNGEILKFAALRTRLRRQNIPNATQEAKKYLIYQGDNCNDFQPDKMY